MNVPDFFALVRSLRAAQRAREAFPGRLARHRVGPEHNALVTEQRRTLEECRRLEAAVDAALKETP